MRQYFLLTGKIVHLKLCIWQSNILNFVGFLIVNKRKTTSFSVSNLKIIYF